jgi:hypothetical protein
MTIRGIDPAAMTKPTVAGDPCCTAAQAIASANM